jgi:hypothetical protein
MPEFQPIPAAHLAAIERPGCPRCRHHRMLLARLESGPSGFGTRTFECQKCGQVRIAADSGDPMTSKMLGWFKGELRPPR